MAEYKQRAKPGPKPRYGPRRLVSVYIPAAWHPQLQAISEQEDRLALSELAVRAIAATYGLSLEDPGSDPEQPPLPITA